MFNINTKKLFKRGQFIVFIEKSINIDEIDKLICYFIMDVFIYRMKEHWIKNLFNNNYFLSLYESGITKKNVHDISNNFNFYNNDPSEETHEQYEIQIQYDDHNEIEQTYTISQQLNRSILKMDILNGNGNENNKLMIKNFMYCEYAHHLVSKDFISDKGECLICERRHKIQKIIELILTLMEKKIKRECARDTDLNIAYLCFIAELKHFDILKYVINNVFGYICNLHLNNIFFCNYSNNNKEILGDIIKYENDGKDIILNKDEEYDIEILIILDDNIKYNKIDILNGYIY